uniref:Uncharacterized protein n=1 Tax=Daucus carota subsp. sativus TaxID=79200 RepID=A0A175YS80_DAUCS
MQFQKTIERIRHIGRSVLASKANENMRLTVTTLIGVLFGILIGLSLSSGLLTLSENIHIKNSSLPDQAKVQTNDTSEIWVPSNPRGAERLPPGFVVPQSDLYPRRLYGKPSEDLTVIPKYLVTFTVGYKQMPNIDAAIKKFSGNFTVLLFHYDNRTSDWDAYEWSKKAIHISVQKQTKWWFAKRFLHPDVVAAYDYIFVWDEDLGVEHFIAEEYIKLVKKHGLEISQPGLDPNRGFTWQMTRRRGDREVHKFVEIMAPVFSREAWRCVWHMIQNDLVHGWGLDFAVRKCVEPAHEKIGVVDAQWIVHQGIPSLGGQGESNNGKPPWQGKHGLEISQPGLDPNRGFTWQMTRRRGDREVHKETEERPGWCPDPHLPPCAGFVEIMAPVFSREAWRCVWHMIQNDLVHGWGLDFAVRKCVEPAHEKIGVVDAQWIVHQGIPSLGGQGESNNGKPPWQGVRERCRSEWKIFQDRIDNAEKDYYKSLETSSST